MLWGGIIERHRTPLVVAGNLTEIRYRGEIVQRYSPNSG